MTEQDEERLPSASWSASVGLLFGGDPPRPHESCMKDLDALGSLGLDCLVPSREWGYGDHYWGVYRDYYKDPFPHSLLSTRQ